MNALGGCIHMKSDNKVETCMELIQETKKISEFMSVLKLFLERVVCEAESGGFIGDGVNDPDNAPKRPAFNALSFLNAYVTPLQRELSKNKHIKVSNESIENALELIGYVREPKPNSNTSHSADENFNEIYEFLTVLFGGH